MDSLTEPLNASTLNVGGAARKGLIAPLIFENLMAAGTDPVRAWQPFREGIEISRLYAAAPDGIACAFLRFASGARLPRHTHIGYEHIFILRGSQTDDHGDHLTGAMLVHPPGTTHAVLSRGGCIVLAIWEKPVSFDQDESTSATF